MGFNEQGFGSENRILKQEHLGAFILEKLHLKLLSH
jgi:hypothetical protein